MSKSNLCFCVNTFDHPCISALLDRPPTPCFLYPRRGYIEFSQKFATQWRRRLRPQRVHLILSSITRRVVLAILVCRSQTTKPNMNADISETIIDRELGFQIRFCSLVRSASLLREYATPILTTTSRPNLWLPQYHAR